MRDRLLVVSQLSIELTTADVDEFEFEVIEHTLPATVAPEASLLVNVFYTPTEANANDEAVLVVSSNDPLSPEIRIRMWSWPKTLEGCGDGVVSFGEYCDPGLSGDQAGACPSACAEPTACASQILTGTACQARCETVYAGAVDGDGCCPGAAYRGLDSDCEEDNPCEPQPFGARVLWNWSNPPLGFMGSLTTTPLVLQLSDDNSDGSINDLDMPDVLMLIMGVTLTNPTSEVSPTQLIALSGDTGQTVFAVDTSAHSLSFGATPAAADIDGDGIVEIVAVQVDDGMTPVGLVAFEHNGVRKWVSDPIDNGTTMEATGGPTIGDMNGDGNVEITFGPRVFDSMGNMLWGHPSRNNNSDIIATFSSFVDLAPNPGFEILDGSTLYSSSGDVIWSYEGVGYPYSSVADCDGDGHAEVLLVGQARTVLLNGDGSVKAGPIPTTSVAPPAAGDINGDGLSEFVLPGPAAIKALNCNLESVMQAGVTDLSGASAAVLFDFDGDGAMEIAYADELNFRVIDGSGNQLYSVGRVSPTGTESPVIADINNDGQAEIVFALASPIPLGDKGVTVLTSSTTPWMDAPSIWNQHYFNPEHIDESGTLLPAEPFWLNFNAIRAQRSLGNGVCGD